MKKILLLIPLFFLSLGLAGARAQTRYLVNLHQPVDSHCYTAYKYTGPSSKRIDMSGGLAWYGGFTLSQVMLSDDPGYAVFDLGGKYDKLMFVLGHADFNTGSGGTGISVDARIVTVYADGRKVLDKLVYPYDTPQRITLDIRGVNELKFVLVRGGGPIAVAEATLWTAGQTPVETGNRITGKPRTLELVRDLQPYFQNVWLSSVSPSGKISSLRINGQEYTSGLSASMERAISGVHEGWAYFNLRKQYTRLSFVVGPQDNVNSGAGSGWITVKADGRIIYEHELTSEAIAQRVTLDVTGCERLSFHSEQASGSLHGGLVDIKVYPAGEEPESGVGVEETVDPRLKTLPDVCKLISNIRPYSALAQTEQQIYDGTSDYITFSMGGVKFNEGIVLYKKVNVLSNETSAFAVFDLGGEFDYMTFTAGYIGKSGAMNNDLLRVYADDELVLEAPLIATAPNQHYTVPLHRCRKLRFENQGSSTLNVAAYGVADIVVYRGEPVENDLFVHPKPACPPTVDLLDLGAPYIHYVSPMGNNMEATYYDGSTQRHYFEVDGRRINKGFMLQTSVHFSLDHGVLSGSDGAVAGALGGAAVGSAFVAGGIAVGGAVVGSTLIGAAAFLMLAAGGEALENSCAAFNTYGEYNSVTFTVACLNPYIRADDYTETLLIGADHKVVAQIGLYETMEPQTITVPIDGCEQLMFWLANTDNWSGQFMFYDITLSKEHVDLDVPKAARISQAVVTQPAWSEKAQQLTWERPKGCGQESIDEFFRVLSNAYEQVGKMMKVAAPRYEIYTYYLESSAGPVVKAVTLESTIGDNLERIAYEHAQCVRHLEQLEELRKTMSQLSFLQANAVLGLPSLGFGAIKGGKLIKYAGKVLKECARLTDLMYEEKLAEARYLKTVVDNALNIDGKQSSETTILCPLFQGEVPPTEELQLVEHFVIR